MQEEIFRFWTFSQFSSCTLFKGMKVYMRQEFVVLSKQQM